MSPKRGAFVFAGLLALVGLLAALSVLSQPPQRAAAAFHLVRIHAVMGGFNGDANIQYVELRMCSPGQTFVGGHTLKFFDGAGTLKATFTFPGGVVNGATGESILIATQEFNTNTVGGDADFTFTSGNTVGSNGGDALHPVQSTGGKVVFADQASDGCDANFSIQAGDVDSVAYGGAAADFGSAAVALPSPSDNRSLRLGALSPGPSNNSTEYSLQAVSASTFSVASGSLASDLTTPRNNARTVLQLTDAPQPTPTPTATLTPTPTATPTPTSTAAPTPTPTPTPTSTSCPAKPWSVPPGDDDCDGWTNAEETLPSAGGVPAIGTDPNNHCGSEWPANLNTTGTGSATRIDIFDVNALAPPVFFSTYPANPNYSPRKDINRTGTGSNGRIDIFDVNRLAPPIFFATCTP
ncbi:MAG: hypothetical protein HYY03_09385 [Chloroflexi bacterium]|nr:hypothetical protein [Chloroflexota bacterium]